MEPRATRSIAEVEVSSKVSIKEVYGVNGLTGKPGKMVVVVFEAPIASQVPPASYAVSESDHILQNVEVSKRFANCRKDRPRASPPIDPCLLHQQAEGSA